MIIIDNLMFDENEEISMDSILKCYPQMGSEDEKLGIPLRVTTGYQCIYDKTYRNLQAVTFYVPPKYSLLKSENKDLTGEPLDIFSYVLASYDGTLTPYKNGVCLINGEDTLIYTGIEIIKSTGQIKKGGIIGKVTQHIFGYGVTVRGYHGGELWNIPNDIYNINSIE